VKWCGPYKNKSIKIITVLPRVCFVLAMFPFSDIDMIDYEQRQSKLLSIMEIVDRKGKIWPNRTAEALLTSFQRLNFYHGKDFNGMTFIDCLACGSEAILYCYILFNFGSLVSIEVSNESCEQGLNYFNKYIASEKSCEIEVIVGRFHDYFRVDADVVYLDTIQLGYYFDESVLLASFFTCCKKLFSGSCIIVVKQSDVLNILEFASSEFKVLIDERLQCTNDSPFCSITVFEKV